MLCFSVVIITGGSDGKNKLKTAEIYHPITNTSFFVRSLPEGRIVHSQDGLLACGGADSNTQKTCVKWSPTSGTWNQSNNLTENRTRHTSWATASGVYLIGGEKSPLTSEKVKFDGSDVPSTFDVRKDARYYIFSSECIDYSTELDFIVLYYNF